MPGGARPGSLPAGSIGVRGLILFFSPIHMHWGGGRISQPDKQAADRVAAGCDEPRKEKVIYYGHARVYGWESWRLRLIADPSDSVFLSIAPRGFIIRLGAERRNNLARRVFRLRAKRASLATS